MLQIEPSARSLPVNQVGESDAAFLLRLAANEGLGLRAGGPGSLVAFPARSVAANSGSVGSTSSSG